MRYHSTNSFLYAHGGKYHEFKAKDFEIQPHLLYLGNISKEFTVNSRETFVLKRFLFHFSLSYELIDVSGFEETHKYLIKKHNIV